LETSISRERLTKYLAANGGDLDGALTLYERNMRLSEAFYVPLQCMEVSFRNRLCAELVVRYGDEWPTNNRAPLNPDALEDIRNAADSTKKAAPSVGDIVAALHFGFWVGLIGPRYDATLWRTALHKAFGVGGGRPRAIVHGRFNALRRFRNRIAHHEPIFDRDLIRSHSEIIEAIGWMCADTSQWAAYHSRLPVTFAA